MSDESAFHDGYMHALEDVDALVGDMTAPSIDAVNRLRAILSQKIEKARCLSTCSLASEASGARGY
jgi:hypothetical protein